MPKTITDFKNAFPRTWESYEHLKDSCEQEGPLDKKTVELIRIGIAVALHHDGGLVAHVSQARKSGATAEEVYHAIRVAAAPAGFSSVLRAFSRARSLLGQ